MNSVDLRLSYEDKAYSWGFRNEVLNTLAADFLQGVCTAADMISPVLPPLPGGVHISKPLREAFFVAGAEISRAKMSLSDENLKLYLAKTLNELADFVKKTVANNGVLASTGDCRGACKYNTGDSSEYRNYGW